MQLSGRVPYRVQGPSLIPSTAERVGLPHSKVIVLTLLVLRYSLLFTKEINIGKVDVKFKENHENRK